MLNRYYIDTIMANFARAFILIYNLYNVICFMYYLLQNKSLRMCAVIAYLLTFQRGFCLTNDDFVIRFSVLNTKYSLSTAYDF